MFNSRAISVAALAALLSVGSPSQGYAFDKIGYVSQWSLVERPDLLIELPVERLTHVVYAFGRIESDGTAAMADACTEIGDCNGSVSPGQIAAGSTFSALQMMKATHPHLKLLIAFGGWNGSEHFSELAASEEARSHFARSVIATFFAPYPGLFDGIDMDWEYPVVGGLSEGTPADRDNLVLLLEALRTELDRFSGDAPRLELSVAVAAAPGMIATAYPASIGAMVDRVQVMTYDYHAGEGLTHFNAPLFPIDDDPAPQANLSASMAAWLTHGIPKDKLVIGIPFYGRALSHVGGGGDGLLRPGDATGSAEWSGDGIAYRDLVARRAGYGFAAFRSAEAGVPYMYDESAGIWISYDDPCSVALKANYARSQGFAGAMAWELGHDDGTLLAAMTDDVQGTHCGSAAQNASR